MRLPFVFDLNDLLADARRKLNNRVDGIEINLPFLSVSVCPDDLEQQVAREIVIRMADRRVLNAWECCDDCIDRALASLQEIRQMLVDQQVKLSKATDGPLYVVIELMLAGIRQFMTFEQHLRLAVDSDLWVPSLVRERRSPTQRETYFAALEMLRAHLWRCLHQIEAIAQVKIPRAQGTMHYEAAWQLDAYKQPVAIGEDVGQVGTTPNEDQSST